MKFLKNYFLAFLVMLSFVAFGFTATVRAESGSDDSDDVEEVEDSNSDSDTDGSVDDDESGDDSEDESSDDSDDENESDDSGNDSDSDLDDSDEDSSDDNSGPGSWKNKPPLPLLKKVGSERPGLFPGIFRENNGEFRSELKMENRSPVADARMRVGARIEAHTKNFENLKIRILSRLDKMEEEGIDTSGIESAISNLEAKIEVAKSAHDELKDLFGSDTADKTSVEAAADKIKSAMMDVHEAFKAVIDAMKDAMPSSETE